MASGSLGTERGSSICVTVTVTLRATKVEGGGGALPSEIKAQKAAGLARKEVGRQLRDSA